MSLGVLHLIVFAISLHCLIVYMSLLSRHFIQINFIVRCLCVFYFSCSYVPCFACNRVTTCCISVRSVALCRCRQFDTVDTMQSRPQFHIFSAHFIISLRSSLLQSVVVGDISDYATYVFLRSSVVSPSNCNCERFYISFIYSIQDLLFSYIRPP